MSTAPGSPTPPDPLAFREATPTFRRTSLRTLVLSFFYCYCAFRSGRFSIIAEENFRRITQGKTIGRDIVNHHTICANNGAFPYGYALHNMGTVPNPRVAANAHGPDVFRIGRAVLGAQIGLPWMAVAIRYAAVIRDDCIVFNDDFLVHRYVGVPSYLRAVPDFQDGSFQDPAGVDRNFSAEIYVIANVNFRMAGNKRKAINRNILAKAGAAGLKQRVAIKDSDQRSGCDDNCKVKGIHGTSGRLEYPRNSRRPRSDHH